MRRHFFPPKTGFTIVETLVVIAIMGLLSIGAIVNIRLGRSESALESAEASLLRGLERARSQASSGVDGKSHGVYVKEKSIVSFEGDSYTGEGLEVFLPPSITTDKTGEPIIFSRLSASASQDVTITLLHQSGTTTKVTVKKDGAILRGE